MILNIKPNFYTGDSESTEYHQISKSSLHNMQHGKNTYVTLSFTPESNHLQKVKHSNLLWNFDLIHRMTESISRLNVPCPNFAISRLCDMSVYTHPSLCFYSIYHHSNLAAQRESIQVKFENFLIVSLKMQAQKFPTADLNQKGVATILKEQKTNS